jgi:hypothetical protein
MIVEMRMKENNLFVGNIIKYGRVVNIEDGFRV